MDRGRIPFILAQGLCRRRRRRLAIHDLRGTAVTRLAVAGCTEAEIAAITGDGLRDVGAILGAHNLHHDPALAESVIRKLEQGTNFPE